MEIGAASRRQDVRPPAVAGSFYPASRKELGREVDDFLGAPREPVPRPGFPKALIVPHAGYVYSGPVAASAFEQLRGARGLVRRVVLLGPCHRVAVRGLALSGAAAFDTPLGRVPVDVGADASLADLPQVIVSDAAHAAEHSLEVQLPFLQAVLGDFELVPLAVGDATAREVAEVLERLWGGPETLVVVSSDLSHYLPYDDARAIDRCTVDTILEGSVDFGHDQACGATPVRGLVEAARVHGLEAELLDLRNSGDTAGDRRRVVGYAAIGYWKPGEARYGRSHGETLVSLARSGIASALGGRAPAIPEVAWLAQERATFVTLTRDGDLRGCIGTLEAHRPLAQDVVANARAAALRDPRFPPVSRAEFASIRIEVSVLSDASPVVFADHDDLLAQLRPGVDGLILAAGGRRGTFLPQVWESLPDPGQFVAHLKQKAGLSASTPTEACRFSRYRVWKWREQDSRPDDAKEDGRASSPAP